jgi:hypothetical protein
MTLVLEECLISPRETSALQRSQNLDLQTSHLEDSGLPSRCALRGAGLLNVPGFPRPKGQRRIPAPASACYWIERNGRLECRWQEASSDAPNGDFDERHGVAGTTARPRPSAARIDKGAIWTKDLVVPRPTAWPVLFCFFVGVPQPIPRARSFRLMEV